MGEAARNEDGGGAGGAGGPVNGEYQRPDPAKAFEIYDKQIKPKKAHIATLTGDCSQPWDDIKELSHMPRPIMNFLIMMLGLEDAKMDHFLRALQLGLQHLELGVVPTDLVSTADGTAGQPIVGAAERPKPKLATLGGKPSDKFTEATDAELEAQKPRADAKAKKEVEAGTSPS